MSNTFERSCDHWSENSRKEMEDFYSLASVDYDHLSKVHDWKSWLIDLQKNCLNDRLHLLDVACGSGKFPSALLKNLNLNSKDLKKIDYSLLDPSSFSIQETAKKLKNPFEVNKKYETTLQDFNCHKGLFDIVWAIHALYAVPKKDLKLAISKLLHSLNGKAFIAHGSSKGHYVKFYKLFVKSFRPKEDFTYTSAEDIMATLDGLNIKYSFQYLSYTNGNSKSSDKKIESYLQRSVFDDQVSLIEMLDHPLTGNYLRGCLSEKQWKFPQKVALIFFENNLKV